MAEKILNLWKKTDNQIQEAQTVPKRIKSKRLTPRHIIIKLSKDKGNLESS